MVLTEKVCILFVLFISVAKAFSPSKCRYSALRSTSPKLSMVFDSIAELAVAAQLRGRVLSPSYMDRSFPMAKSESVTKQGMYREYTVDIVDDSALDEFKRGYKTADETDESKNKYWTILAVLVFGSFAIPMVQYYWYVAEED